MAEALLAGLVKSKVVESKRICVTDIDPERLKVLQERFGVEVSMTNQKPSAQADILILAVKPQVLDEVCSGLDSSSGKDRLLISVLAGTPIAAILNRMHPKTKIIRAMPNTPAIMLEGISALAAGPGVTEKEFEQAEQIFTSVGKVVRVKETLMDAVTALSGGGPAYVYMFIDALADGGVKMGLSRPIALLLAAQTVYGAAKMVLESGEHPGILKDRVASPGGTTMAGLHELEKGRLRATLINAVERATMRSTELGRESADKIIPSIRSAKYSLKKRAFKSA